MDIAIRYFRQNAFVDHLLWRDVIFLVSCCTACSKKNNCDKIFAFFLHFGHNAAIFAPPFITLDAFVLALHAQSSTSNKTDRYIITFAKIP